jgi:predicted  nucleic acid-binding Zn-ribbon protein
MHKVPLTQSFAVRPPNYFMSEHIATQQLHVTQPKDEYVDERVLNLEAEVTTMQASIQTFQESLQKLQETMDAVVNYQNKCQTTLDGVFNQMFGMQSKIGNITDMNNQFSSSINRELSNQKLVLQNLDEKLKTFEQQIRTITNL